MNKKRTYKGDFDFIDFIKESLNDEYEKAYKFAQNGRPSERATEFKFKEMPKDNVEWGGDELGRVRIWATKYKGEWTAPVGYNDYSTGTIPGCKTIIMPGATINTRIFESIKFEMV
jgi:hypothetical protein